MATIRLLRNFQEFMVIIEMETQGTRQKMELLIVVMK
jgi:hypothetical protein